MSTAVTVMPKHEPEQDAVFVSTKETARLLGVSRNHVYELLDRKQIQCKYIGRRRMVVNASLRAFIAALPSERD